MQQDVSQLMEKCEPENVVSLVPSRHLNAGHIIDPSCGTIDGCLGQARCINQLDSRFGTQMLQCHGKIRRLLSTEAFHGRNGFTQCLLRKFAGFFLRCLYLSLTQPCGYGMRFLGVIQRNAECYFQLLVQIIVFPGSLRADLKEREQRLDFLFG